MARGKLDTVRRHEYIIRGYHPGTYRQDYIKDEDIVRPPNHRLETDVDKANNWLHRSVPRCPTYGTCLRCYASGPVGLQCISCEGERKGIYTALYYQTKVLDSLTLSNWLPTGFKAARADRRYEVGTQFPSVTVGIDWLTIAVDSMGNNEYTRKQIYGHVMDMLKP